MKRERLPDWIKIDFKHDPTVLKLKKDLKSRKLFTVCEEARCPNLSECFGKKKTATFMILGRNCTRNCAFCNIANSDTTSIDPNEPRNIAEMTKELELKHVVITSVTRDDLEDGGSEQFVKVIKEIRNITKATIEVLTPDFEGVEVDRQRVSVAKPEIYNHNVETVPELYDIIRPQAIHKRSIEFLKGIKKDDPSILTKSGIMVGLGETDDQLKSLLDDIVSAQVDIFTCGQYLRPSKLNYKVQEYKTEEWFEKFKEIAMNAGIKNVYSSPFTRSSYNASEIIDKIKSSKLN
ncbi:MAG: lipoyl synthase [Candidatus Delongbacteria bacterium]|nr:lipoyl synthase [Candidatus Delongbacteria bacterium]